MGNLLSAGGTTTTVKVYYGDTDGGNVPAAWGASSNLGVKAEGEVTYVMTGLSSASIYYYRFFAANVYGGVWAGTAVRFTAASLPALSNVPARSVRTTTAVAGADIISTGAVPTTVSVYYGPSDGGTTSSAWNRVLNLGMQPVGRVSATLTGLSPGSDCYYRFFAANTAGGVWAGSSEKFTTKTLFDPWGYTKAMQIVITGYSGVEMLENFPTLVVLSNGSADVFYYTDMLSPPNADLRFVDTDGSELNYEIDTWNSTDQSFVWVQVPLLYNGAVITCFWGKAGASSPVCTSNGTTWSEGFLSVHHLSTNYTDGTWVLDSAADLSSGNFGVWGELVDYGTPYYEADDWQAGKIGMSIALNSEDTETTEYIALADGYESFKHGLTFSVWVNENTVAGAGVWQPFIDIDDWGEYMILYDSEGYIDFYTWVDEQYGWEDDFTAGQWYNTVVTLSKGGGFTAYQNGVLWWTAGGLTFSSNEYLRTYNYLGWSGWEEWLPGRLDDVQVADVVRSPEWVKAAYDNQNDPSTFAAYTPAEVPIPEPAAAAAGLVVGCWLWAVRRRKRGD